MALSLSDLDALLADPTVGAVHAAARSAIPHLNQPSPALVAGAAGNAVAKPTGIPSLAGTPAAAPDMGAPSMTGIPSLAPSTPTLAAPSRQASHEAGKREFEEGIPKITAEPGSPDYYKEQLAASDWKKMHPLGSDISEKPGFVGKLEHGLATAGNIAGDILAPRTMEGIPGTQANEAARRQTWTAQLGEAEKNKLEEEQGQGWQPMTVTGPNGEQITIPEKFAPAIEGAAIRGGVSERNTDVNAGTKMGVEAQKEQNMKPYRDALAEYQNAQAALANSKNDPSSPQYKLEKERADAAQAMLGSYQPLYDPKSGAVTGFYNTKNPQKTEAAPAAITQGGGTTGAGLRTDTTRQNQFNTQYVNPANQAEQQYQRATQAVQEYNSNPKTGAAAMVLFAQHLGTTLGGIKGAAIGEGAQKMHADAIGLEDRAQRYLDYLKTGQPLSANQVHDFYDLIGKTRQLQWETTAREGARRGVPIDFVPNDVQLRMSDSKGNVREVPGDKVQDYVTKGAKIQY